MLFRVISFAESRALTANKACFLVNDGWDDFGFKTLFQLIYFGENGKRLDLGDVKITFKGQSEGRTVLDDKFTFLATKYCSLGQSQEYYETLMLVPEGDRTDILIALRDLAWNEEMYSEFEQEEGVQTSLLRGVSIASVDKFRSILRQRSEPIAYQFTYKFPLGPILDFNVLPTVIPPTNIHVVIGRNGVGKTRLLSAISRLLRSASSDDIAGELGQLSFRIGETEEDGPRFANLIDVAFSVFDDFEPAPSGGTQSGIHYSYIGLRRRGEDAEPARPKSLDEFAEEFVNSTLVCLRSSRKQHWLAAMAALETDPIFAAMALTHIDDEANPEALARLYRFASSGHKIVLLSMTRLVELVAERTLVLIDEPEAHLHPPLAASFIRALSALLASRNGVAILATHSPVMLQEVPKDCVWLLFRTGGNVNAERSQVETFAENIGVLTREVFRLEVTNSGYHSLIANIIDQSGSLEASIETFRGHIGAEGRALARVLWRARAE